MITSVHTLVYSDDPAATRAFFKDVLRWPFVSDEASGGDGGDDPSNWLIFRSGRSELGVHPTSGEGWSTTRHTELSLMCDDIAATVAELRDRGAVIHGEPEDRGFGIAVDVEVPGADSIMVYEPKHRVAYGL
ncbi:MAG TPA: VOC family protein [Lapillicoccus sp.]|jgi:predicted enzyme related to lactoylglutathione lyase|nr:VOC family protein [Lapillicoccus sp.]